MNGLINVTLLENEYAFANAFNRKTKKEFGRTAPHSKFSYKIHFTLSMEFHANCTELSFILHCKQ